MENAFSTTSPTRRPGTSSSWWNWSAVGDYPEPPTGDTHPENLRTVLAKVENVDNKLDQVLDRLPAAAQIPPLA
jgi:hypothetical protein